MQEEKKGSDVAAMRRHAKKDRLERQMRGREDRKEKGWG